MEQVVGYDRDALCQKGFYPYEWFDDVAKFDHDGLPPSNEFYSQLSQTNISEDNYKHAQKVYNQLGCKPINDYHVIYLKCYYIFHEILCQMTLYFLQSFFDL
jgi:hypothetical protein